MEATEFEPVTVIVGDLHLKAHSILPRVDRVISDAAAGRVVLVGDYCDDWGKGDAEALADLGFLAGHVEAWRRGGLRVDCLMGNHDYAPWARDDACSGTRPRIWAEEREVLERIGVRAATTVAGALVTHAGLTASWAAGAGLPPDMSAPEAASMLNGMLGSPDEVRLGDTGAERGGWDLPGPLWAGAGELLSGRYPGIRQIVGHTPCDTAGTAVEAFPKIAAALAKMPDADGILFCDTFSTWRDGSPSGDESVLVVDEGSGDVRKVLTGRA